MSVNKYRPHVLVLPEDDANGRLANGFVLGLDQSLLTRIQVLPPVGGWREVLDHLISDQLNGMNLFADRFLVLLIDFDGDYNNRLPYAKARIPLHLADRVFILGALTEPEALKGVLGPYETIGSKMASDCREGTDATWGHNLLGHNAAELERLRHSVRPFLFA